MIGLSQLNCFTNWDRFMLMSGGQRDGWDGHSGENEADTTDKVAS